MTKEKKKEKTTKCIICNNHFTGYGHNPEPLESSHFKCCDNCNITQIVPYRIYKLTDIK